MKINLKIFLSCLSALVFYLTAHSQPTILITYHSHTGNTQEMAEAVALGANRVEGVKVVLKLVAETTTQDLLDAAAIVVGSPVYNANVTPEVLNFMVSWPFEGGLLKDKIGAAFVTAGGFSAGEELAQTNILHSMLIFGMIVVGGPEWNMAFGASAVVDEKPFDQTDGIAPQFLYKANALGKRVAELALKLHRE